MIAALYVETDGAYFGIEGVDPWDELRDARKYSGPHRVVAHPVALERYGYEKARRIGMMAMVGGKDKTRIRNATPEPFRDVLLAIARDEYARSSNDNKRKANNDNLPLLPLMNISGDPLAEWERNK